MVIRKVVRIKRKIRRIISSVPLSKRYYCCICEKYIGRFIPFRGGISASPPLMLALKVVGSNVDLFKCPRCLCSDRERHLYLYMKKIGLLDELHNKEIIHFAPERKLSKIIEARNPAKYVKADLMPRKPGVMQIDLQNIGFQDNHFDLIIANHVLEHVDDLNKSLSEINRVLKKNGGAILQTPYSSKLHNTFSDPGIDDDLSRVHAYGQENHVRLFGNDIIELISSYGFTSGVKYHNEILPEFSYVKYGLNPDEPFLLFWKP